MFAPSDSKHSLLTKTRHPLEAPDYLLSTSTGILVLLMIPYLSFGCEGSVWKSKLMKGELLYRQRRISLEAECLDLSRLPLNILLGKGFTATELAPLSAHCWTNAVATQNVFFLSLILVSNVGWTWIVSKWRRSCFVFIRLHINLFFFSVLPTWDYICNLYCTVLPPVKLHQWCFSVK